MANKIVVIGAGFTGVWSALSAKRLIGLKNKDNDTQVVLIAPEPSLVIRPRLYEANPVNLSHPVNHLFESAGIAFIQGMVDTIDTKAHTVRVQQAAGVEAIVVYDRLILAAGSSVVQPQSVTGLQQHAFDIDSLASATKLDNHLKNLPSRTASISRDTVVVCGAGFTGIELAAELPKRLGHIANARVILVESADEVGPELGPGPRSIIVQALKDLKIEVKLGARVSSVDAHGVTLASGERIASQTVIWTAGVRATLLTQQIPGPQDALSRLHVDAYLRAASTEHVFVTGDAACALADTEGHHALMSCQHALQLGRVSGHNAAADVLGEPMMEYSQAAYNCCLDLGSWGAVIGGGWEREVKLTGELAKRVKSYINQQVIYPPVDVQEAIALANPIGPDSDELFRNMLKVVG